MIPIGKNTDMEELLIENNIPYLCEKTRNSKKITTLEKPNSVYYSSPSNLSKRSLGFISRVLKSGERYIKENGIPFVDRQKLRYNSFNKIKNGKFYDVIELDINGAYWNVAKNSGYINEKLYLEGLKVKKTIRLISCGAWATVKNNYHFDGKKKKTNPPLRKDTASLFFSLIKKIGFMLDVMENTLDVDYLLFWTDALFIQTKDKEKVLEFFKTFNLEMKEKELDYIQITNKDERTVLQVKEKNGKIKIFTKNSGNIEQRITNNLRINKIRENERKNVE